MARKLALIFMLIQLQLTLTLALPTPLSNSQPENSIASSSSSHASTNKPPQLHDKRSFFPETLPDKAELEDMLRETMRQAGFAPSSQPELRSTSEHQDSQFSLQKQKCLLNPDTGIDSAGASARADMHTHWDTKLSDQVQIQSLSQFRFTETIRLYASEKHCVSWPPMGYFVVVAAIVCLCTVLRGIRAKK
jgi:hypothetical protein